MKLLDVVDNLIEEGKYFGNPSQSKLQQIFQINVKFDVELWLDYHATQDGGLLRPRCSQLAKFKHGCYKKEEEIAMKRFGVTEIIPTDEIIAVIKRLLPQITSHIQNKGITVWDGNIANLGYEKGSSMFTFYSNKRILNGTLFFHYDPADTFKVLLVVNNLRRINFEAKNEQLIISEVKITDRQMIPVQHLATLNPIEIPVTCQIEDGIIINPELYAYVFDHSKIILDDHKTLFNQNGVSIQIISSINNTIKTMSKLGKSNVKQSGINFLFKII